MTNVGDLLPYAAAIAAAYFAIKCYLRERRVLQRFSGILSVESATADATKKLDEVIAERDALVVENKAKRTTLQEEYNNACKRLEQLKSEVASTESTMEAQSYGLYKPHFDFNTPEEYKKKIQELRDKQKNLVQEGKAVTCAIEWRVEGSRKEGERMVKRHQKLALRAFNGECDAALADVSWNNISKMEERISKSHEAINKLGEVQQINISPEYMDLKLNELRAKFELEQSKQREREEQRRVREQIREEEKAKKEIEQAKNNAEVEEQRFQAALVKAREEANAATGAQLRKLTEQIASFEAKLDEARKKKERAIARAQLTKSGFVYVISNIGSFGEKVVKIGMTRRLEPMERVLELGGASVPFPFDLHAMLYSDNAPDLETALHHHFEDRKLNLVNARREFFRDVDLAEVEKFIRARGLSAQFITEAEAREYRQSVAMRERGETPEPGTSEFADSLFDEDVAA